MERGDAVPFPYARSLWALLVDETALHCQAHLRVGTALFVRFFRGGILLEELAIAHGQF